MLDLADSQKARDVYHLIITDDEVVLLRQSRLANRRKLVLTCWRLQMGLVIPYEQITNTVRHRKTIAAARPEPHKFAHFVMSACIDFSSDHLQRNPQRLNRIDPSAPSFNASFGPFDLETANPIHFRLLRHMDPNWNLNIPAIIAGE